MEYRITASPDGHYIFLKVSGNVDRRQGTAMTVEAHTLGRELAIDRYLVDMTEAVNIDSTLDQYEFVHSDMRTAPGIDRYARVATLVSRNDHSHDFIEIVGRNAGLDLRLFTDRESAIQFLLGARVQAEHAVSDGSSPKNLR